MRHATNNTTNNESEATMTINGTTYEIINRNETIIIVKRPRGTQRYMVTDRGEGCEPRYSKPVAGGRDLDLV